MAAETIHVDRWTRLWKGVGNLRVRESMDKKKHEGGARKKKKEEGNRDTKTTVTIPDTKGVSEALSQVFHHRGVVTAMKPPAIGC